MALTLLSTIKEAYLNGEKTPDGAPFTPEEAELIEDRLLIATPEDIVAAQTFLFQKEVAGGDVGKFFVTSAGKNFALSYQKFLVDPCVISKKSSFRSRNEIKVEIWRRAECFASDFSLSAVSQEALYKGLAIQVWHQLGYHSFTSAFDKALSDSRGLETKKETSRNKIEGEVEIQLVIGSDGKVMTSEVVSRSVDSSIAIEIRRAAHRLSFPPLPPGLQSFTFTRNVQLLEI